MIYAGKLRSSAALKDNHRHQSAPGSGSQILPYSYIGPAFQEVAIALKASGLVLESKSLLPALACHSTYYEPSLASRGSLM